ncbi:TPM domain-containing protein [Microbacterium hominis]|uniref:TPM domain-containing protein n=1 Tax=Microbacterium hominis TaxID=162426 RepID=A0A7D4QD80_9MICO|nr:TPM domain-containing protein [Microbacterium hominis]QKJ19937.1 TPM domain-containing protein [Microbacterium hominis]
MRVRWTAATAAAIGLALAAGATAAVATPPVDLGTGYVVDQADVLDAGEEAAAQARLEETLAATGADLYVVFVDTFTDPANSQEWADEVAALNGLGPSQYLLAVSVDGRQYYISADTSGPMSDEALLQVESDIRPSLSDGDFAGAVDAAADGFEAELGTGAGGSGSGGFAALLVIVGVLVAIAVIVWLVARSRRAKRPAAGAVAGPGQPAAPQVPTAELARQAASALIAADDAIKTSEQELGFARAQFGDDATVEFAGALATARANLDEAFTLQQQLDDEVPDTEAQVREWNGRIIELCAQSDAELDAKAEAFDELRELEKDAPAALARVEAARQAAGAGIEPARTTLAALTPKYAADALATVADNPDQANERLAFADAQLGAARSAIDAGDGGQAAVGIRAAEEAVAQAGVLTAAVGKLGADLAAAEQGAAALLAELEQDVAAAGALPDADGRIAAAVTAVRQQVDAARANLTGATRPILALQGLETANEQIDAVIAGARSAQERAARARQVLGQVMTQAQAQVSTAEDFITTRRGAVGAQARTRLAEAGAALVRAQQVQSSDPEQALQHAQRADQLAGQAIQAAQRDVSSFSGGGMFGEAPSRGGGNDGMLGAVLGGIVINSLLGSGGGGASRSRGRSAGFSSGGFSGGSRGGRSAGSFGGGGTRGRRGGGRF